MEQKNRNRALILELTEKMLSAAQEQDWDLLVTLEVSRSPALKNYFSQDHAPHQIDQIQQDILYILSADKEITIFVNRQRDNILKELGQLTHNRKAIKQYQQLRK